MHGGTSRSTTRTICVSRGSTSQRQRTVNNFEIFFYFVCFAIIAGGAFAMMWSNIQSINMMMDEPPKSKHPEAPKEGDEVLYVDMTRERLESLYNEDEN